MRAIIYTLTSVVLLLSSTAVCYAQQTSNEAKKTTIELFIPVQHFSGSKTNWSIFSLNRKRRDRRGHSLPVLSFSIGFQYSREITKKGSVMFSLLSTRITSGFTANSVWRYFDLYSVGYLHRVMKKKALSTYVLGSIGYRHGYEWFYVEDDGLYYYKELIYNDFGLAAGIRAEYTVLSSFLILGEAKVTHFFADYAKDPRFEGWRRQASPSMTTLKLGLGYRF